MRTFIIKAKHPVYLTSYHIDNSCEALPTKAVQHLITAFVTYLCNHYTRLPTHIQNAFCALLSGERQNAVPIRLR